MIHQIYHYAKVTINSLTEGIRWVTSETRISDGMLGSAIQGGAP